MRDMEKEADSVKIRYDLKGKYFTEVVRKRPRQALIHTVEHRITGTIHVSPEKRLTDELNEGSRFLALTDAHIVGPEGEIETSFLALSKDHIVWIIPQDPIGDDDEPTDLD